MKRVYSNLKFFGFADQLNALRKGEVAAPVHVRIKPINRCNHDCWYCAYRASNLQLGEKMDLGDVLPKDKMLELADDLIDMGVKAVTFSGGGEPTLYKRLPDIIERLAMGGIKVAALTNGSNLKGRMAEALAKHGTWVWVSVDAWDDASYAKARGIKEGAFTKLLENIRAFHAMESDCELGISFTVGKENHAHIAEIAELFKDAGAQHMKVSGAVVSNDMHEVNLYHREIADAVLAQIEQAQRLELDGFHIVNHYHEMEERFEKDYETCPFLQYLTVIGADGGVYTCQDKAYTEAGRLGSIADQSFKKFWRSPENRDAIYGLNPSRSCRHHCVAHSKNLALHEILSVDTDHGVFV